MAKRNAVEVRMDRIGEEWAAFMADPVARVARWRLDSDGAELVEGFMEAQTAEESSLEDFFLRLTVPVTDPAQHGDHLRAAFLSELEAAADDIREAGVDPEWPVPTPDPRLDDIGRLLHCVGIFAQHYSDLFPRVVLVLMRAPTGDPGAWAWWVDRLVRHPFPERVRAMLFDPAEAPVLDGLAQHHAAVFATLAPELDTPGMLDELVRQVGGSGPADVYRRFFVGMGSAAARGDVAGAMAMAQRAAQTAQGQGWIQQVAVVQIALGSILLGAGRLEEALKACRAAGASGAKSQEAGDPGSERVVVQAKLSEASVFLQAGAFVEAAQCYEEAAALIEGWAEPDLILLLDAHRMAGYCHERAGREDAALHHLGSTLQVAGRMEPDRRLDTTLPWAVRALGDLTGKPAWAHYRPPVEERLLELLGPEWPRLVQERLPA